MAHQKTLLSILRLLAVSFFLVFVTTTSYAQNGNFFDGINRDDNGSENAAPRSKKVSPQRPKSATTKNLIALKPLQVTVGRTEIVDLHPQVDDSRLVQKKFLRNGAIVKRGALLQLSFNFSYPKKLKYFRKVVLFSNLKNPKQNLPQATLVEMNQSGKSGLKWLKTTGRTYISAAILKNWLQVKLKKTSGNIRHYNGKLWLETANLKPGTYFFVVDMRRKNGKRVIEKQKQAFKFKLVAAPLYMAANIPTTIPTYDSKKDSLTAQKTGHTIMLSDWAVRPLRATIRSTGRSATFGYGDTSSDDLQAKVFEITTLPKPSLAGKRSRLIIKITDGLGRTASLQHDYTIVDGRAFQIKVSMPSSVRAGGILRGTIRYPRGFTLTKKPFVGDKRGFAWTNSSYTAFRIRVKEQGVHHKRMVGIVAVGRIKGVNYKPTLTVQQTYKVRSQNLIYDKERNRRRTEANDRAWREAFRAVAAGVKVAAKAKAKQQARKRHQKIAARKRKKNTRKNVYRPTAPRYTPTYTPNPTRTTKRTGSPNFGGLNRSPQLKPLSTIQPRKRKIAGGQGGSGTQRKPAGNRSNPDKITDTSVCGIPILKGKLGADDATKSDWVILRHTKVKENGKYYDVIELIKKYTTGRNSKNFRWLSFYERDCVMQSEKVPSLTSALAVYTNYYTNGGRKFHQESNRYEKGWDRRGNLIYHDKNGKIICRNRNRGPSTPKCS